MNTAQHDELRSLEALRTHALVTRDMTTAERLHADVCELVTPRGDLLSRVAYLRSIASGELHYQRFEAVSGIEIRACDSNLAVLRYRCAIDV